MRAHSTAPGRERRLPAPQSQPTRRNRRVLLISSLLIVVAFGGYWFLGWPRIGPTTVISKSHALFLEVPRGWTATTPWNSPRTTWPLVGGPSRVAWPSSGPDPVEDIRMATRAPASNSTITIFLDIAPSDIELSELHTRDNARLLESAVRVPSPVRAAPSLASRSRPAETIREVVTVRSQHYAVTAVVLADDETALRAANNVLSTLAVRDDT